MVDIFGKFGEGAKSVLDAIAESAPVVPIPDRDVTFSLERDLCSGLYGALDGGAGPCKQLYRGGGECEGHQSRATSQIYRGLGKLGR